MYEAFDNTYTYCTITIIRALLLLTIFIIVCDWATVVTAFMADMGMLDFAVSSLCY